MLKIETPIANSLHLSVLWSLDLCCDVSMYHPVIGPHHSVRSFSLFLFHSFFFLLLFTFHAHIYGHIAMDLVRSVRFHEIKSSCCRYCICVKAFYSMLLLYVFAWNRSNSNRVVFYGITLSICYTLSHPPLVRVRIDFISVGAMVTLLSSSFLSFL